MKNNEQLNRLHNKIDQEFFIGKKHLMSCITVDQADTVSSWMGEVNNKWDNEFDIIVRSMLVRNRVKALEKYNEHILMISDEWKELCEDKIQELNPQQPKEEPKPQPTFVVKGFV